MPFLSIPLPNFSYFVHHAQVLGSTVKRGLTLMTAQRRPYFPPSLRLLIRPHLSMRSSSSSFLLLCIIYRSHLISFFWRIWNRSCFGFLFDVLCCCWCIFFSYSLALYCFRTENSRGVGIQFANCFLFQYVFWHLDLVSNI